MIHSYFLAHHATDVIGSSLKEAFVGDLLFTNGVFFLTKAGGEPNERIDNNGL